MNLLLTFVTEGGGRDWSNDLRTGKSGAGTLCNCTLLRMSYVSFSRRTGKAGRISGMSLGEGSGATLLLFCGGDDLWLELFNFSATE